QASTDALTGCATRVTVEPWLLEALGRLGREEVVATLFVDVDAFKLVNDRHGHATGDAVLAALGDRLRSVGRADDLVARIGGDEFLLAVVLPRSSVASLTNRVRAAADFDLEHAGHVISVRCSVGCAISDEASDPTTLVAVADVEMYREKALHGR
ncbi:MAG: GGDEF domain-containing protein, partial [Actinomycetota bacterium]